MFKRTISLILSVSLILAQPIFAQGVGELNIGKYLSQMPVVNTDSFRPPQLRYISYDIKSNDFKLLLDQGDAKLSNSPNSPTPKLQESTQELFNYFLIGLSLPNDKFWVNLRPDAPEQIIDPLLEKTDMGKIMLEADLELKKDTAGLTSPQNPEGKEYWDKLYKKAGELFGTENITIPTITRPWIVPGEVIIRESEDSAYIYKANLKVMLEEDYLTGRGGSRTAPTYQQYTFSDPRMKELNKYSTQLIRELILPGLTQEINTSKKYAQLRQVFFSLILSRWFKDKYKGKPGQYSSLIDSRNLDKLGSNENWNKEYYFNEYKKSFHQGEYNLKEQVSTPTGQVIRSYVSGGIKPVPEDISSFRQVGSSSPTDWGVLIPIITTITIIGSISILYKMHIDDRVELRRKEYEKLTGIRNSIRDILSHYVDNKLLTTNDATIVNHKLSDYQSFELEETIRVVEATIKLLKSFKKLSDLTQQKAREEVIVILEGSLKAIDKTTGSSPLAPQEGASSAVVDLKDEIRKILIDLKNNLPKEVKLKSGQDIGDMPNDISDEYRLLYWAKSIKDLLYEKWYEVAYAKQDWWERFMEGFSNKDSHSILRIKYPKIDAAFGAARDKLEKVGEDIRKREKAFILMERKKKVEDFISVSANKEKIMAVSRFREDFMRRTEARNNRSVPKRDEDIPYLCYMIYSVLLLDGSTPEVDEWRQAYQSEIGHSYITHSYGNFDKTLDDPGISQAANDEMGSSHSSDYHGVDLDEGSSPLVSHETQTQETDLKTGGIDFTRINYLTRPMGSFQGLDLCLPLLSKVELEEIDINKELASLEQMINSKIDVSTDRLKRLLAAMSQKDAFTSQREAQLLPLLMRLCWLKEEKGSETTPDFRAVLLIADTGLFVEQGNLKYSLN